jgi:hypothetical protein
MEARTKKQWRRREEAEKSAKRGLPKGAKRQASCTVMRREATDEEGGGA